MHSARPSTASSELANRLGKQQNEEAQLGVNEGEIVTKRFVTDIKIKYKSKLQIKLR
jgi:hypothetical protein